VILLWRKIAQNTAHGQGCQRLKYLRQTHSFSAFFGENAGEFAGAEWKLQLCESKKTLLFKMVVNGMHNL